MADFGPAFLLERKYEGYYVNDPADKGGETYAGIPRNPGYHPEWIGWSAVDAYKSQIGRAVKTNEKILSAEPFVQSFYQGLWNQKGFGNIKSQDVANIVFDFFINSGITGIKKVQEVLRDTFKQTVAIDGTLGNDTIIKINAQDPAKLNNAIKQKRIEFYDSLVAKDASQAKFLPGWLARINSFPTLTKAGIGLASVATGIGIFFLVRYLVRKRKARKNAA